MRGAYGPSDGVGRAGAVTQDEGHAGEVKGVAQARGQIRLIGGVVQARFIDKQRDARRVLAGLWA